MEIQHKYKLGQKVYLMYNNAVASFRIQQIGYNINDKKRDVLWYYLEEIGGNRPESLLFATKEDLIKSL